MVTTRALLLAALAAPLTTASASESRRHSRAVDQLDEEATAEAHQRDDTATRAFSDVPIVTSDGRCLFVDPLSGDFRANLTPIQVGACSKNSGSGSGSGQGWDVITDGLHNDQPGTVLIVSTLTQACFNSDGRNDNVNLFSCGGRAAGEGTVTDSQLFEVDLDGDGAGPLSFRPRNAEEQCFTVDGDVVGAADCDEGNEAQLFTFGEAGLSRRNGLGGGNLSLDFSRFRGGSRTRSGRSRGGRRNRKGRNRNGGGGGRGGGFPPQQPPSEEELNAPGPGNDDNDDGGGNGNNDGDDEEVPVSRGGTLDPGAAAEAHEFDGTATRPVQQVSLRTSTGECVSVDPTAGDSRQNLIPLELVACSGAPGQKFDFISEGRNNDGSVDDAVLVTSTLTDGCVSADGRREEGDEVTLFSCGGRAAGDGKTDVAQLVRVPEIEDGAGGHEEEFVWEPVGSRGDACIVPGETEGRLVLGACGGNDSVFTIIHVGPDA